MSALEPAMIGELKRRTPRAFGPGPVTRIVRGVVLLAILGYLLYLSHKLGLISMTFVSGFAHLGTIIADMWPPEPNGAQTLSLIFERLGETVAMALIGTTIAAAIAVPLGFIGARTMIRNPVLHFALRRVFDVFRGMPSLIWALIFARAVGLGPLTGILAFIAADFAALAKLNAEAIETAEAGPVEGVQAAGAPRLYVLRFGLLPQIMPVMLGQALYFFESNVRAAAILGIVGAGGIGVMLDEAIRFNLWREVAFIVLLFLVLVALIDQGSRWLREKLIGRAQ
jgi:phosphonate transport system permease protein